MDEGGTTALLRQLRPLISEEGPVPASDWRGDLRLFCVTWAMGFLFFLLLIA